MLLVALNALVAGVLEAVLLVLVMRAAVSVAEGTGSFDPGVPLLDNLDLTPGSALVVAAAAGFVMLVLHLSLAWLTARLSAGVLRSARARAMEAFAHASWARQAEDREGALQETVSSLVSQVAELVLRLGNLVSSGMALAILLIAALIVDPVVTVVVLAFGILIFFVLRPVSRMTRRRARDFVARNSAFNEHITQWGALAMELRVFGVESSELARMAQHNDGTSQALARSRFAMRAGSELYRDLAIICLVAAVAALNVVEVELASVGAVVFLIIRSLSYAQMTNTAAQSINELGPNLEAFYERLASLEAAREPAGRRPLEVIERIELADVGYDYEPGRPGVDGVTLELAFGEALGVIGPSGGGKSTLVQVLLRLRPPSRGRVLVAGIPYEEVDPSAWHRLVAMVPQEPKLFQATVADNITFFRPGHSREQIEQAAASAHVLDDIRRLPGGLDTLLGPRGAGLSGGQKQRVAIARALLGRPQLLVLDEPTSALDVRSEQLLQQTIESLKGQVSLVIIAHRLTTLACCDRVLALEGGRVKVIGTLEEALAHVSFAEDLSGESGRKEASGCE